MRLSAFLAELKRRHVLRVAAMYVVAGLAFLEAADVVLPALDAPDAVMTVLVVLVAALFPLVLVLAWAYELSTRGIHRDPGPPEASPTSEESADAPAPAATTGGRRASAVVPIRTDADGRPAVAVLPFTNVNESAENGYYALGMTEDVIRHLAGLGGLRVISRTSVMKYTEVQESLPEIARALGVGYVLEGSVRTAGDRIRIVAQLIEAETDSHLWAESYDRGIADIFTVQSEVAACVARCLNRELTGEELAQLETPRTTSVEAYRLYQEGLTLLETWLPADLHRAIGRFERAVQIDPRFPDPWVGIALACNWIPMFGNDEPLPVWKRLREAAERALTLDPTLGLAHTARGWMRMSVRWDWRGAEADFRTGAQLSPDDEWTHLAWAMALGFEERFDEAWDVCARGLRLGGSRFARTGIAWIHQLQGSYEESEALQTEILDEDPDYFIALHQRMLSRLYLGDFVGARADHERVLALDPGSHMLRMLDATLELAEGRPERARATLEALERERAERFVNPYCTGSLRLALGDVDGGVGDCRAAAEARALPVLLFRVIPRFRPLRAHPDFQRILQEIWPDHGPFSP